MRVRAKRVLAVSAVIVTALIAVALIALHTTTVQSRILQWSVDELERRFDLGLSAATLDFNLLSRRATLTDVRLAAAGHGANPFFSARSVVVRLPWAAYRGRLHFDEIAVDGGSVTIERDANGVSNLPPGRGRIDPNAPPRRIDARALVVRNLDFSYRDLQRDIEVRTPRIRTDLAYKVGTGASGPFAIEGGLFVRVRRQQTEMKPIAGRMIFDGSNVQLADVGLDTPEGAFNLAGRIERALDQPTLDLTLKGTADVARASLWAKPPIPVAGPAAIDATMRGAPTEFVLESRVVAAAMEVGRETGVRLDADSRLTPNGIKVTRSTIVPATGGQIHATLDVPFSAEASWWVTADWSGLDAASAFRLADVQPWPFGAALVGTVRVDSTGGQPYRLEAHNTSSPRSAAGTAPLQGEVEFFIEGSRWRANQSHLMGATKVDGRLGGAWVREAAIRSTFEGDLTLASGDVGQATRFANLFGLSTPSIVTGAKGPVDANVSVGGTFSVPRFVGTLRSDGVDVPSIGTASLTAQFDASARSVSATGIEATIRTDPQKADGATLKGDVFADLDSRALSGALRLDAESAANVLSVLPEALRLDGPLAATVTLGGTVDRPDVAAEITGSGLELAGQPVDSLLVKARVVDEGVNVESFTMRQGDGELRATGRYEWSARRYTVDLNGQNLSWKGALGRLGDAEVRAAVKFAGAGTIDQPAGEGVVEFAVAGGVAGDLIERGIANVRLDGNTAVVTAQVPSLRAFVTANVVPRQPFEYDAVVVMHRVDLSPVVNLVGLEGSQVSGTASLSASAKGLLTDPAKSQVFVNLQDIQADVSGVTLALVTPSRLSWDGNGLTVDALDLTVGKGRLIARGRLGEGGIETARWESTFKGELGDLLRIGRPLGVPAALDGSGLLTVEWRSDGGLDRSIASVRMAGGTLAWADLPAVRELNLDAGFDGSTIEVTRLNGQWQDGGLEGTASVPRVVLDGRDASGPALAADQTGFARLRVTGLSETAFSPWLSPAALASIDGRISATLDARIGRASLDGITGTLTLDEAAFTLAGVQVEQLRPSILSIEGGIVTARDVAFNAGGSPLTLTGTAHLTPADKQTLDLALRGQADLRIISAFAPTLAADGDAKINLGIGGPLSAPVFNGGIDLAGAELAIREPRVVISDLNGTIALDGKRVLFDNMVGAVNGGSLTLDGGLLLEGVKATAGGITAQVQRAAIEYPSGMQSEVDALITMRPAQSGWTLEGEVRVERSIYNQTISLPSLVAARGAPTVPAGPPGWADELRLNLFVSTQQDTRLDNNYGRLEAGAALRIVGTATRPVLAGRVTLREGGEVYLAGNTFRVARGSISFTNPNRILPEFDIELRTLVSGKEIILTLDGPLDRLQSEVRSPDPDVDSREAMSLLFGGFQGEDAVALLSAELLGATGRAIGLDTLRVQRGFDTEEYRADPGLIANETDPATRLTLSKRLRPDVELILSQSLSESGDLSAIISYKPRRNIELRAVSRDNVDRSIALRHEITFAGATAGDLEAAGAQPTVSAVTISGDPNRPTAELMAGLTLDAGDVFDFHRWQRDIDTLRDEYHKQHFYEVRVRGTRQVSEDGGTVALDYRIEPGPLSELVVDGHPLEPELEEEVREAWRRTIFDRFLLEDMRMRISRHLIAEKVIGSMVDAVVAISTPERKQIRVTVTAGTPVSKQSIRYSGNTAHDADRLDNEIAARGLTIDAWLDPARAAEALQAFYRNDGYLNAAVKAGEPAVQGGEGILPVTIVEGPRFPIAELTVAGVSPSRLSAVTAALRVSSGTPYTVAELDAATRRVEELYARDGFNEVQIEWTRGRASKPTA